MTCEVISKQDVRKPQYSCLEYCSDFPSGLLELNLVPPKLPEGSCLGGGTVSLLCSNGPISCRGKPRSLETIMPWVTWGLTLKPLPYCCHDSHAALDTQGGLVPTQGPRTCNVPCLEPDVIMATPLLPSHLSLKITVSVTISLITSTPPPPSFHTPLSWFNFFKIYFIEI